MPRRPSHQLQPATVLLLPLLLVLVAPTLGGASSEPAWHARGRQQQPRHKQHARPSRQQQQLHTLAAGPSTHAHPRPSEEAAAAAADAGSHEQHRQQGPRTRIPRAPVPALAHTQQQQDQVQQPQEECGPLTAALLARVASNGTLLLAVTDASTGPQLLPHFLGNLAAAGVSNWVVAATDTAVSRYLAWLGHAGRCYRLAGTEASVQAEAYWHGGGDWKAATWLKVKAARELLSMGYDVLLSDVDVAWLADPLPLLSAGLAASADFLASLDAHHTANAPGDGSGLEADFTLGPAKNTGIYLARATHGVLALFDRWLGQQGADTHDQLGLKLLLDAEAAAGEDQQLEFVAGSDRRLGMVLGVAMGHLALANFLHSYSFSVVRLHQLQRTQAYAVHQVFGYGQLPSKLWRLRDARLSWDPPESPYFSPPGGLLSFDLILPDEPPGFTAWSTADASKTEEDMELVHIRALDSQLQQLYHAFGLALALNRTLLLPRLRCFCARGWFELHACRLAGDSRSALPFWCTGDQVWDIEALLQPSTAVGGVLLSVRPPGFASDRHLPAVLKQGPSLRVTPGQPRCDGPRPAPARRAQQLGAPGSLTAAAAAAAQPALVEPWSDEAGAGSSNSSRGGCVQQQGDGSLVVPAGLADAEALAQLLAAWQDSPWLHFSNVTAAFTQFRTRDARSAFRRLLATLPAREWCCRRQARVERGTPHGHVFALRPWGSRQMLCARPSRQPDDQRVFTYLC